MLSNFYSNPPIRCFPMYYVILKQKFFAAIESNQQYEVDEFINMGMDINCTDEHLSTPLHIAAGLGHLSIVKMLLSDQRVNVFAINEYNQTPLTVARTTRYFKIIEILTIAEQNIFEQSIANNYSFVQWENTLSVAVKCGYSNVVAKLLSLYNYNIDFKPYLYIALKNGSMQIINVIEEHLYKLNPNNNSLNILIDQLMPINIKIFILNKIINFCKRRLMYGIFNQLMANKLIDHMLTLVRLKKYNYKNRFDYAGIFCISPLFLIAAYGDYDGLKRLWKVITDIGDNHDVTFVDLVKDAWLQEGIVYGQKVNILSYFSLCRQNNNYHNYRLEILLRTIPFCLSSDLKSHAFLLACIQLNKYAIKKFIDYNKQFLQSIKCMLMIFARKNILQDHAIFIGAFVGFIKTAISENGSLIISLGDLISINITDHLGRSALHSVTRFAPSIHHKRSVFEIIRMLLDAKADPSLKDHQNNTPLSFAKLQPRNNAIISMLESAANFNQYRSPNLMWQHNLNYRQPLPGSVREYRKNPKDIDFGILRREKSFTSNVDNSNLHLENASKQAVSSNSRSLRFNP